MGEPSIREGDTGRMKVVGPPLPRLKYTPVKTTMGAIPETITETIDNILLIEGKTRILSRTYMVDGLFTEAKAKVDGEDFTIVERAYLWDEDSDEEGFPSPPDFTNIWMHPDLKKRLPTADFFSLVFQIGSRKFQWQLLSEGAARKPYWDSDETFWVYHLHLEEGEEIA